jgi:hypothetical protein
MQKEGFQVFYQGLGTCLAQAALSMVQYFPHEFATEIPMTMFTSKIQTNFGHNPIPP